MEVMPPEEETCCRDALYVSLLAEVRLDKGAQKVIDRLVQVLRPRAAGQTIKAAAMVLFRSAEPAIEVRLRSANYSRDVTAPFTLATSGLFRRRRKLTLGEFTTREAANELF